MVQAIIKIDDEANRTLNIIKAKYGLKDKSAAINLMAKQYEEEIMSSNLRPEYIKKAGEIHNEESIKIGSLDDLKNRY